MNKIIENYDRALKAALEHAKKKFPESPGQWHGYANSVAQSLTRMSGGYGGPRMREHFAARLRWQCMPTLEEALERMEKVFFGPLTREMARMREIEHCFDDPAEDIAALGGVLPAWSEA